MSLRGGGGGGSWRGLFSVLLSFPPHHRCRLPQRAGGSCSQAAAPGLGERRAWLERCPIHLPPDTHTYSGLWGWVAGPGWVPALSLLCWGGVGRGEGRRWGGNRYNSPAAAQGPGAAPPAGGIKRGCGGMAFSSLPQTRSFRPLPRPGARPKREVFPPFPLPPPENPYRSRPRRSGSSVGEMRLG